jgi:hypothetical protein
MMMPGSLVWDARTIDLPSFMTPHFMVLHTKFTMEACMCFIFLILCSQLCSSAKLRVLCYNMCVTKLSRFTVHYHISGRGPRGVVHFPIATSGLPTEQL